VAQFFHDAFEFSFLQRALLAGLLASVVCGVVGTYVVARRITYVAGSIAHCVLGGLGAARFAQVNLGWQWCDPLYGALAAAIGAACLIGLASLRAREREDTVIGALWAVGMAVGVVFIAHTHGYSEDLMAYLFGDILLVSRADLWLMLGLDALAVGLGLVFYRVLLASSFDEEFTRVRGVGVERFYILLLCLTALTVVVLVRVVGIVLVIALLTLPAAIAGRFVRSLAPMMVLAAVLCAVFTTGGLVLSYGPDWPAGATIVLVAGAAYLLTTVMSGRLQSARSNRAG
jgi:zinc transport system permease protein